MTGRRWMAAVAVALVVAGGLGGALLAGATSDRCPPFTENPEWSAARRWNEVLLAAIARDLPAPTVHSRNLFHLSVAMWDAWAAFDPGAQGYLVDEDHTARDLEAARDEAIGYAAHRVLESRYLDSIGATDSIPEFDALLEAFCLPIEVTTTEGDTPAALGNRIAAAVLEAGGNDGSNQAEGYTAPDYQPVNDALDVAGHTIALADPNRWQPLRLELMLSQNGIWIESGVQEFVGPHWGHVDGFALPDGGELGLPLDPGAPPYLGDPGSDQEFKDAVVEVIRYSGLLDADSDRTIDVSPGALGANPLGTNDGAGHATNPATGLPYEPNLVAEADFARALAEYWADGPRSETPPGHWNTIANEVSDDLGDELRVAGSGPTLDRLEWDVKLYLALNAANHDAAIAAWGAKGHYDYVRPISMIWHMGSRGQSSDPDQPAYHPEGLPLTPGVVELVTDETTEPGARHASLAGHEGRVAIRAWSGNPADPETDTGGTDWILPTDWVPYQQPTFVTPSFAGYVSGHSTFSRASAEVLAGFTGSEYFPGGLREWTVAPGSFEVEAGPDRELTMQAATYFDAADQAGLSRLYGGIHVRADDLAGRRIGAQIGRSCLARALTYFGGSADASGRPGG